MTRQELEARTLARIDEEIRKHRYWQDYYREQSQEYQEKALVLEEERAALALAFAVEPHDRLEIQELQASQRVMP